MQSILKRWHWISAIVLAGVWICVWSAAAEATTPLVLVPARSGLPLARPAGPAHASGGTPFPCQKPEAEYACYGPVQIRHAYHFPPYISNPATNGSGHTIVIIDAHQDPTIESDLAKFDAVFGLPAPSFEIVAPFGSLPFEQENEADVGWSLEIALDVEWAHATAPGAKIVLALSPTEDQHDTLEIERYVVAHELGDVISMSYVEGEECETPAFLAEEHQVFVTAVEHGMTPVAGAGDVGASAFNCELNEPVGHREVSVPASDPNVTSVGGTELSANRTSGHYLGETVWNEPLEKGAGGGGFSSVYATPKYQRSVPGIASQRGVPDVTYDAGNHGGMAVVWGSSGEPQEEWDVSGTSAGTPQWAGLVADADAVAHRRLGNVNPALYSIGQGPRAAEAFHDITSGNNSFEEVTGYEAGPGWDAASGWGSPYATVLMRLLAASKAEHGDQGAGLLPAATHVKPVGAGHVHPL